MLKLLENLSSVIRLKGGNVRNDTFYFRLHYHWTTLFCFFLCILVLARDIIGEPIRCFRDERQADSAYNLYCWIISTFTINTTNSKETFYHAAGSNFSGTGFYIEGLHKKRVHLYYQWVPLILFMQGCFFYAPHVVWKALEDNRLQSLLQDFNIFALSDEVNKKKETIIRYFQEFRGCNQTYSFWYSLCESLNALIVLGQMIALNKSLGGVFLSYGIDIVKFELEHESVRHDPLIYNFPRIAKCTYYKYGGSGTIQSEDMMCLLPQNILNEKIFVFMWFWLVLLLTFGCTKIVINVATAFVFKFRLVKLRMLANMKPSASLIDFVKELPVGDFCLLYLIGRNTHKVVFKDILTLLVKTENLASIGDTGIRGTRAREPFIGGDIPRGIRGHEMQRLER